MFSERDASRALAAGDVWALVGPSEQMLAAAARSSNVKLAAPASGTALWADLWTVPAAAGADAGCSAEDDAPMPSPLLPLWIEFALQPARYYPKSIVNVKHCCERRTLPSMNDLQRSTSAPRWLPHKLLLCRAHRSKGLQHGASPLLLPAVQSRPSGDASESSISQLVGGVMPADAVLRRSEFLFPLDAETERLYERLLSTLPGS